MAPKIYGFVRPGFEAVREAFARNFDEGREGGATFCAVRRGETLVDIWAGEQAPGKPWRKDTIVNVWSTTKGAAALCCAICQDRGLLDYNEKVAKYWPEFAENGKGDITVAEALSHQAGLCGIRPSRFGPDGADFTIEDMYDWDKTCAQLVRQKPFFKPGESNGYHAFTHGFIAGELVRRVTGQTIGNFFRENVAEKLGLDFHIGTPESEHHRIALVVPDKGGNMGGDQSALEAAAFKADMSPEKREKLIAVISAFSNPSVASENGKSPVHSKAWRLAEMPSVNGHANAAACARMYCCLANGGELDGVRLLSASGVAASTRMNCHRKDLVLQHPVRWGMGFMLNDPLMGGQGPNSAAFGHGGAGGSMSFADPLHGLGCSYVMTHMSSVLNGDPRALRLFEALYGCLGQPFKYQRGKDGMPMQTFALQSSVNGNLSGGKPVKARL